MSDLNRKNEFEDFHSHPDKKLYVHTEGVTRRVMKRTALQIARIASLFHDVGKVNPNFQAKVDPRLAGKGDKGGVSGYSSHAYLSAITFLSFPNRKLKSVLGLQTMLDVLSIVALAARHHGNLRNFAKADKKSHNVSAEVDIDLRSILSEEEYIRASEHIKRCANMPLAEFAAYLLKTDVSFEIDPCLHNDLKFTPLAMKDALDFFMDTQFAFASLVESDKRDASNNDDERRRDGIRALTAILAEKLTKPIVSVTASRNSKVDALNAVRTQIREETLHNLAIGLVDGRRVFSLAAPTGAGKTLTLLAVANAILQYRNEEDVTNPVELCGIIYTLPFLSITEQVECVCEGLLPNHLVLRADSSANHPEIDKLMRDADKNPTAAEKLLREDFAELVFDSPLVITTFVQFFETLMSHRNATLLKLPNFARSVIVIDEVQALPPRLYVFFTAYLSAFCRKFDAYVIISTATMPNLRLTNEPALKPSEFFPEYQEPFPLVSTGHFQGECFRRYVVEPRWDINSLESLADSVVNETTSGNSVMVVLNTIADTRELYQLLNTAPKKREVLLLNTRFIPRHRRAKIQRCKKLPKRTPLVLITTQLIEAGVDIDFPVVFRDLCPLPNLVQTAGRCNRHNKLPDIGRVILVDIKFERGRSHAEMIYSQDMDRWYLNFTREAIQQPIREDEFLEVQQQFFEKVSANLSMGKHPRLRDKPEQSNLMLCIRDAAFEDVGRFKLIQEEGEMFSFYVPASAADDSFEGLERLAAEIALLKKTGNFKEIRLKRIKLESHLRRMRERIVQARIKAEIARCLGPEDPVMGIYKLTNRDNYTEEFGLEIDKDDQFF